MSVSPIIHLAQVWKTSKNTRDKKEKNKPEASMAIEQAENSNQSPRFEDLGGAVEKEDQG